MNPPKWRLIVAVSLGIAAMLAAKFVFHVRRHAGKLGFAVMLLVLFLFTRPWHTSGGLELDDDERDGED